MHYWTEMHKERRGTIKTLLWRRNTDLGTQRHLEFLHSVENRFQEQGTMENMCQEQGQWGVGARSRGKRGTGAMSMRQ